MTLEGIDTSVYQGYIDWGMVAAAGKSFAFVKATQGTGYQDPTFGHNWASLRYRHMVRGAYHFYIAGQDPRAQVDNLHAYVHRHGHFDYGDMVVLDVEEESGITGPDSIPAILEWVDYATRSIAKQIVIYTNPNTWINVLGNPDIPDLHNAPLWLADYGPSIPSLATWPHGISFWQYSDTGHCPGVSGAVDLNRYFGDLSSLRKVAVYTG